MAQNRDALLRNLVAGYGDSIRLSDIKANIAVLFVAIMMGTVLQFRTLYPWYLGVPILLAPFICIFFSLLASVYPRYPSAGRKWFPIKRNSNPEDFDFLENPPRPDDLPERCALLSRLLYWKTVTLQFAYLASMATIVASAILLFLGR